MRIIVKVIVLIRRLPLMKENSFLSLARIANRFQLEKTLPTIKINGLRTF